MATFGLNSIGGRLVIALALVLPILVWELGKEAAHSLRSYDEIKLLNRQNAAANALIDGVYHALLERLATNNALLAEQVAGADALGEIEKERSLVVAKISAAYAGLSEQEFPNKAALLVELKAAIDRADADRAKADAAVKRAKTEREAETAKNLFASLTDLSSVAQKVWSAVLSNTSQYDPELGRLSNLRMLSWNLREIAGTERSHIAAAMSSNSRIPPERLAAIAENRAQIALMWRFVLAALKQNEHPAITKGVQLAKDGYFAGFQPLADQMSKASIESGRYPMAQRQWVDTTTPQLFALLEVMYGAGVASEEHTAGAQTAALRSLIASLALLGIGGAAFIIAVLMVMRSIIRPLKRLTDAMRELGSGNLGMLVPGLERKDEIGDMARTVDIFRKNGLEVERMRDEQATAEQRTAEQRRAEMHRLADRFESAVGEIVQAVSSASTQLETSASKLTSTADRAQELTTRVAAASEQASANVQSVATATEEMSSSVNEISRQVQESARMAGDAVGQARSTTERVSELSTAATRIGDVVELISSIAGQTNLLALNATIEAARAGDAGRGFAVVASEVKALAEQTAKATDEIGQQIAAIQAATGQSVGAIKEISGTIERLSEISASIAGAVEEQDAATHEIARNVQQAAQGTQQVSSNIADVQRGATETGSASSEVLSAAQTLSSDSSRLKVEVGKFLQSVRTA